MNVVILSKSNHKECFSALLEKILLEPQNNREILTRIIDVIDHISKQGGHPSPPQAKPLREVDGELCEIRIKWNKNNELLRIYYFVDKEKNTMNLLNAIIKPEKYEKKIQKKVEKMITGSIQLAIELKKSLPQSYEPFQ